MFDKELKNHYPEATKFIASAIKKHKLPNSYVFIGNDYNDILKIAASISKFVNCQGKNPPCEKCTNCKWINDNKHPQAFITILPDDTSKKEQIKIDTIRELLQSLQLSSAYFRIVFFGKSNLNTLTAECCNLLLKTIEEAPENILFIFANNSKDEIIPTILSRSQLICLHKKLDNLYKSFENSVLNKEREISHVPSTHIEAIEDSVYKHKLIEENNLEIKEFLASLLVQNIENDCKDLYSLYKNLSKAYMKSTSFMNTKYVLEDLSLEQL